jgi:hypothetical protein
MSITPPGASVLCMSVLVRSSILAVGSDDFKIRFCGLDSGTLRQELTYDTAGSWPMSMTVFEFPEDPREMSDVPSNKEIAGMEREKRALAPWFCWGDNSGEGTYGTVFLVLGFFGSFIFLRLFLFDISCISKRF